MQGDRRDQIVVFNIIKIFYYINSGLSSFQTIERTDSSGIMWRTEAERLEVIRGSRSAWGKSQVLFAAGAITFALGTALMAFQLTGRASTALVIPAKNLIAAYKPDVEFVPDNSQI